MRKIFILYGIIFVTMSSLFADAEWDTDELTLAADPSLCHRLDFDVGYSFRDPSEIYSSVEEFNMTYYYKESTTSTLLLGASGYTQNEGNGLLGKVGLYHDWSDSLYTFSSITAGTNTNYLPRFRIDHDFYYKLKGASGWVIPFGGTYINYFTPNSQWVVSSGVLLYTGKWILGARLFLIDCMPGNMFSTSQKITISYGSEKNWRSFLDIYFGKEAYMATYLANPAQIRRKSFGFIFNHRHWIGSDWGLLITGNYAYTEGPYIIYRALFGLFKEW